MKKVFYFIVSATLLTACGNGNNGDKKDSATTNTTTPATTPETASADDPGLQLIASSDCTTCHKINEKNIGPAYADVAEKYRNVPHAIDTLVQKVIKGGYGNWGTVPMTPHPNLSPDTVRQMVAYILNLKKSS